MNVDCVGFVDWVMPVMWVFGFAVGACVGILIGIIIEWRLIRRIIKEEDADDRESTNR